MGAVHAEIEHLLKERNIRNPGRILFSQTLQCYCVGSSICLSGGGGGGCLRIRNNLDFLCYFYSINVQFLRLSISQLSKWYREKLEFFISTSGGIALCVTHSIPRVYQL